MKETDVRCKKRESRWEMFAVSSPSLSGWEDMGPERVRHLPVVT